MSKKNARHNGNNGPTQSGNAAPEYISAMREIRRSNATVPIPLPKFRGSRKARKEQAIRDNDHN